MKDKLKFMEGKEVHQEEMKPVLSISKIFIIPLLLGYIVHISQLINMAGVIVFIIFAILGYIDSKEQVKENE